jgi:hypothetical protein
VEEEKTSKPKDEAGSSGGPISVYDPRNMAEMAATLKKAKEEEKRRNEILERLVEDGAPKQ